jgi:hypothetical protein
MQVQVIGATFSYPKFASAPPFIPCLSRCPTSAIPLKSHRTSVRKKTMHQRLAKSMCPLKRPSFSQRSFKSSGMPWVASGCECTLPFHCLLRMNMAHKTQFLPPAGSSSLLSNMNGVSFGDVALTGGLYGCVAIGASLWLALPHRTLCLICSFYRFTPLPASLPSWAWFSALSSWTARNESIVRWASCFVFFAYARALTSHVFKVGISFVIVSIPYNASGFSRRLETWRILTAFPPDSQSLSFLSTAAASLLIVLRMYVFVYILS